MVFSMLLFMLTKYTESDANRLVIFIPMWLTCSCLSAHLFMYAWTMILLSFIAISSMTTMLSLNDQYGCNSSFTFAFLTAIHVLCKLSGHLDGHHLYISCLISSAVMHSTLLQCWCIIPSLESLHLCLNCCYILITNLLLITAILACTGFLCFIGECTAVSYAASVTGLLHPSWKLPPIVCDLVSHWPHSWSSSDGILPIPAIFQVLLFQYYRTLFPH